MDKKQSFFEKKSVIATFGVLALIGGFFFIAPYFTGNVTGNFIATNNYFNLIPVIGILLLICSVILIAYTIVKK